ncbi:MAG: signal peptidase I [Nitrospirae bacterium]|nr:signal peptidase I [Nitrospirota bacterium]
MLKKLRLDTFFFIVALTMCGMWTPERFSYSSTRSLNYRLFFLDRAVNDAQLLNGAYIVFKLRSHYVPNREVLAVKRIRCSPGDSLKVRQKDFFCNEQFLGKAKGLTLRGEKTVVFQYDGIIPAGQFFIMGTHPDSLDSRYVGFINEKDITAIAYPII